MDFGEAFAQLVNGYYMLIDNYILDRPTAVTTSHLKYSSLFILVSIPPFLLTLPHYLMKSSSSL